MVKEELIIGGYRVELLGSLDPNLTFSITDIASPDKRKADFSKTITLPGSKRLNKIFEFLFEVNLALQTFNPNLKTSVVYLVDGETNLDGFLQLKQINVTDTNDITYEVTIIGRVGDFITDVGNSYLTDLDLSGLNHVYNEATQIATWNLPLSTDYVYPMINYNINYSTNSNPETWKVIDFYPAITVKKYIDEIFDAVGYSYTSTFFDSAFFKTLIVPFSDKSFKITDTQITNRRFKADTPEWQTTGSVDLALVESTQPYVPNQQSSQIIFTNEISDAGGVHDPATGVYTVSDTGYYNINFEIQLQATFAPTGASEDVNVISGIVGNLEMRNYYTGGGGAYNQLDWRSLGMIYESNASPAYPADFVIAASSTGTTDAVPPAPWNSNYREYRRQGWRSQFTPSTWGVHLDWQSNSNSIPNKYNLQASGVYLTAGDEIKIFGDWWFGPLGQYGVYPTGTGIENELFSGVAAPHNKYTGTATVKLLSGTLFNQVADSTYQEGNTILMSNTIPKKIKQKDFFMSIVKMFNLYVQTETNNDKNLIIEPRDDFYLGGTSNVVDWSKKLDISQPLEILPMGALDSKDYLYTYKQDKDYYNKLYNETWIDRIYGDKIYDEYDNDFLKKTHNTKVIFSPTPSVGQAWYDRVIPTIIKTDSNGHAQRTESNIRILQWGGLKATDFVWFHKDNADIAASTPGTSNITYPYAGMYSDPYSPTIDTGFGLTREIYWDDSYGAITLTNNNIFNIYHKKFIEEITDKDSKIVKGWFNINSTDIRSLSFRKLYWFEEAYYRLNKIENYNPQNPITKCEFLKIREADVFVASTTVAVGGNASLGGQPVPNFAISNNTLKNGNSIGNLNNNVFGNNNYISRSAANVTVSGDNNKVFSDCNNVNISGSGNTVSAGLSNVTLINTNDITVIANDTTYIDNAQKGSIVTITSADTTDEAIETYLCDTSGGSISLQLNTAPTIIGKTWNIKVIEASNTVSVRATPNTIDGAASKSMTTLYETKTVMWDGSNYQIISEF